MPTAIVTITNNKVKHYWYENQTDAIKSAKSMDAPGTDVYWAMADFAEQSRKAAAVRAVEWLWLDIDCGEGKPYETKADGINALRATTLPEPTMLVDSGNGVHVYWRLDQPYLADEWAETASKLKRYCITAPLHVDHVVTADSARILRVPGTTNWKDAENPKQVHLIERTATRYSLKQFNTYLPNVGPQRAVHKSNEWDIEEDYPKVAMKTVLQGCQQVRHAAKLQGNGIDEPYWRAVLSVVSRCDSGDKYIHAVSKGDPRYDYEETKLKAASTLGPATCEHFASVNPKGCAGCQYKGAVRSPIAIIPTVEVPEEEAKEEFPPKLGDWFITQAGVYRTIEGDDGVVEKAWACRVPVWGRNFRTRMGETDTDDDEAKVELRWQRPDGAWRRNLLPLSLIGSPSKMMEWAGGQGLGTLITNVKVWNMYISELTNDLLRRQSVTAYYSRLGWHNNYTEFVLGKRMITAEGSVEAKIERNGPLARLNSLGNLDDWKKAIDVLNKPGYEAHMFCVLAGFGAPLLSLMDVSGAAVSLAGASGRGKTLAAKAALSIFGNPDDLFQAADATVNSVDMHLATLHSVPYLMDEVTSLPDKKIGNLLYMIANGRGKDSLTRSRAWREGGTWRTLAFFTTNRPIMDAGQDTLTEAQRNRAIEIIVHNTIDSDDAALVYKGLSKHYGTAGESFLQYVIQNTDNVRSLFDSCLLKIKAAFGDMDAQRFGVWALAAAMAGGVIARKLNLVQCDPERVVLDVVPVMRQQADNTLSPEEQFIEVVREWLTRESDKIADTGTSGGYNIGFLNDPIARKDGADLYLHNSRLRDELRSQQVSMSVLRDFMETHGIKNKKMRLASGMPPVQCSVLPLAMVFGEE